MSLNPQTLELLANEELLAGLTGACGGYCGYLTSQAERHRAVHGHCSASCRGLRLL